jgi:hypothetical protein
MNQQTLYHETGKQEHLCGSSITFWWQEKAPFRHEIVPKMSSSLSKSELKRDSCQIFA